MTSLPRPSKQCIHPGCRTTVVAGNARCQLHLAAQQAARNDISRLRASQTTEQRTRKYGPGWKAQRLRIIKRDRGCAYCGSQGGGYPLEVHHLTTNDRPADRELVTLCKRHHRAIEAEAKRGTIGKVGTRIQQWMEGQ